MITDDAARIALLVIFGGSLPVALYFRLRAARSGERISHAAEGWRMFVPLRLAGLAMMAGTIAYLINPAWMRWSSFPLDPSLRWAGGAVALLAVPLFIWTLSALGDNLTDTVVTRDRHTLVTNGPYRYVRHPFYVATLLLVVGTSLLTANALIGAAGIAAFVLLAIRSNQEERLLIERFGDEYRTYMSRTGRFFPRCAA